MMGPSHLGSTFDLKGVWEIFYRLNILIEWGTHEYKDWFDKCVLTWCRKGIQDVEAE